MRVAIAVVVAVAHFVEQAQTLERTLEDALAAHFVHVARAVEGQRREQGGINIGVELHEMRVFGLG